MIQKATLLKPYLCSVKEYTYGYYNIVVYDTVKDKISISVITKHKDNRISEFKHTYGENKLNFIYIEKFHNDKSVDSQIKEKIKNLEKSNILNQNETNVLVEKHITLVSRIKKEVYRLIDKYSVKVMPVFYTGLKEFTIKLVDSEINDEDEDVNVIVYSYEKQYYIYYHKGKKITKNAILEEIFK